MPDASTAHGQATAWTPVGCMRRGICIVSALWCISAGAGTPPWQPDPTELRNALAGAIQPWVASHGAESDTRIDIMPEWPNVELPIPADTSVQLVAECIPADVRPASRMVLRVDVRVGNRSIRSLLVPTKVGIWRQAWLARRDLAVGALEGNLLAAPDGAPALMRTQVDIASAAAWPWVGELHGMRLRLPVLAGQVLEAAQVIPTRAVSRGDLVVVRSRVGTVEIQAQARAQRDADIGQDVPVRVGTATGAVMTQVVQAGVVEIKQ